MTGPIVRVDTAALEALARELAGLSDRLTGEGITHEWQPPVPQPTGQATRDVTAAANHVAGVPTRSTRGEARRRCRHRKR
ncbi:MAG TPA: hypothetical protein VE666_09115 [Mycobacterium sp.]|nr:hypothetical protein [Mycobacterium sp.]